MAKKNPYGRLPTVIVKLTDDEIIEKAAELNNEDDVLRSYGLLARQVETIKKNKRWRKCWDMGYAKGVIKKNKELFDSEEPSIQKLYAEKVMPDTFNSDVKIEWKAPKWFYEEFDTNKIKKVRKEVVD